VPWRAWWTPVCLEIMLERAGLTTRYSWTKQGVIIIHRLNRRLMSLFSENPFCSSAEQCGTGLEHMFRFPRYFGWFFCLIISIFFPIIWTVIRRQFKSFPELFASCHMFERFLLSRFLDTVGTVVYETNICDVIRCTFILCSVFTLWSKTSSPAAVVYYFVGLTLQV
jgi:hypothetical protein